MYCNHLASGASEGGTGVQDLPHDLRAKSRDEAVVQIRTNV